MLVLVRRAVYRVRVLRTGTLYYECSLLRFSLQLRTYPCALSRSLHADLADGVRVHAEAEGSPGLLYVTSCDRPGGVRKALNTLVGSVSTTLRAPS
jgi:hypothetical protein